MHPFRPRLADHLIAELRAGIGSKRWSEWLPHERVLAAELKVSRGSLRAALKVLRAEGSIEAQRGRGNRVLRSDGALAARRRQNPTVCLLSPGELMASRPIRLLDQGLLRSELAEQGVTFRLIEQRRCYGSRPEAALAALFARERADCWIVRLATERMQRWLATHAPNTILAGTPFPAIKLACVDTDHVAIARHAAGTLLAAGHTRLALLIDGASKAGDLDTERGFSAATAGRAETRIVHVAAGVAAVARTVKRLLDAAKPVTALLVTQPTTYLTVTGVLAARRLRVPQEVSLIALRDDALLSFLTPEPTTYRANAARYTRTMLAQVRQCLVEGGVIPQAHLLLPQFVRGGSVARIA